ncbi:hypothetical protein Q8G40_29360, partial [Klebsiella pneumoniae]|uniref:hypothetical protein n=1 Tax=Klebsiella pneumoniae TaxID=573 RepID=UPI003013A673
MNELNPRAGTKPERESVKGFNFLNWTPLILIFLSESCLFNWEFGNSVAIFSCYVIYVPMTYQLRFLFNYS